LAKPASAPKAAPGAAAKAKGQRQATGAHGLEWRGGKLWISNPPSQKLYRVEPKNLTIENEIATPGDRPHGIGWEGKHLWLTDSNHNAFYKLDVETGVYSEKIQLADSDPLPHGMTVWQGWMWYCDDVGVVCRCKL
jgi:sugar lactone lactonase YvrE